MRVVILAAVVISSTVFASSNSIYNSLAKESSTKKRYSIEDDRSFKNSNFLQKAPEYKEKSNFETYATTTKDDNIYDKPKQPNVQTIIRERDSSINEPQKNYHLNYNVK
ncbi:MAG: hypothetical protein U9N42_08205 [Campylobacterota bacterium]|nr:hypothetical protein [Campylobacterota bacterium]